MTATYTISVSERINKTPVAIIYDDYSLVGQSLPLSEQRRREHRVTIDEAIEHTLARKYDPRFHTALFVEWNDGVRSWVTIRRWRDDSRIWFESACQSTMFTAIKQAV